MQIGGGGRRQGGGRNDDEWRTGGTQVTQQAGGGVSDCPMCRAQLPEAARFCPSCGTRLEAPGAEATERKVVTTLFADLVGFTALGERHDPEDLDAALRAYFDLARCTIERYGGVVEKFIGDAVVGLFGVPLAHEDDAERGVRAALEIVAHMSRLPPVGDDALEVRSAVNTGPAVVRLDARLETGEGVLVGDAVNTCARLLSEAPSMAVVAGELTHSLTARAIAYESLPSRTVKGKSTPVERWVARGPVARKGVRAEPATPMIGRRRHLGVLTGMLDEAVASRRPQHALVTGEAGVGKTRLVQEFYRQVDERPALLCIWRQGRCPAYGERLAYWGLGEVVAGHAGILQSDPPAVAEEKLSRSLGALGDDEWLLGRLRPLVGLQGAQTDRDDSFTAWLQYIRCLAEERPAVLVFEDVHWASEPMLAFLARLVDDVVDVPLLLVLTARPEFLDRMPEFPQVHGLERIDLRSLTPQEAVRLAHQLKGSADIPDLVDLVVENCGGNPLFIEELIRYANDRTSISGVPATLQMLIASRLDALPPAQRETLSDAAVVGHVFWPGALEALDGRDRPRIDEILDDLCRREFLVVGDASTIESERELSFWHALIRDVAYERLPRATRAAKHAAVAKWLEHTADRRDNLVELRAFHYLTAHRFSMAVRDDRLAEELRPPAMSALKDAGDRLLSTDVRGAEARYAEALTLAQPSDELRAHLTVGLADVRMQQARYDEAVGLLREGATKLEAQGDAGNAAIAMARISSVLYWGGNQGAHTAEALREEALALLDQDKPTEALVVVLEECAVQAVRDYRYEDGIVLADRAMTMSRQLGMPERVRAAAYRGAALSGSGDPGGLAELRRAWELARARGDALTADAACQMLAEDTYGFEGPAAALALAEAGYAQAEKRGARLPALWFRDQMVQHKRLAGEFTAALKDAQEIEASLDAGEAFELADVRLQLVHLRRVLGEPAEARRLLGLVTATDDLHVSILLPLNILLAALCLDEGDLDGARASLRLLRPTVVAQGVLIVPPAELALLARTAFAAHDLRLAEIVLASSLPNRSVDRCVRATLDGLLAERRGDFERAVGALIQSREGWEELGNPWEGAFSARDLASCLAALGDTEGARIRLGEARASFARLGAPPAVAATDELARGLGL
jgi:class 3 adenylate cyclase